MATVTRLSLREFLAAPETKPASEFACGEVLQKPMPTRTHSFLQTYLAAMLFQFLARTSFGRVATEWRCIFGPARRERAYVPDLLVVSTERLPGGDEPYLRTAPDLAVEILSPGQPVRAFVAKIQFYLLHGVRLIWVIDPASEVVLVLRPGEDDLTLTIGDRLEGGDVLPGFSVAVRDLFAQLQS